MKTPWYERYKVDVPEGQVGDWKVERFTVTKPEADLFNTRAMYSYSERGNYILPGDFTRLIQRRAGVVMSDTMSEIRDHLGPIHKAHGRCLVNGLGLGMVVGAMLEKAEVDHVTVVELSPEVIALVAPHYLGRYGGARLEVVEADAFAHKPPRGVRYDVVWHDIWMHATTDNLPTMTKLHRKYGRRCDWQDSWKRAHLRLLRRQERAREREKRWWRQ